MFVDGVVDIGRGAASGIGGNADETLAVVADCDRIAVGVGERRELAGAIVAGGGAIAVRVFDVVDLSVGAETRNGAVGIAS